VLAIDDFVWNQDSFGGMWSNYYLYYHLWEQKFYLLTWDQNLALGWMWWGRGWMRGNNWSWWMMGWFGWWMWFWMRWWMMQW
jgi:spore coat protein CotH